MYLDVSQEVNKLHTTMMKHILFVITILLLVFSGCGKSTPKVKYGPFAKTFYYIKQAHADTASLKGSVKTIEYYNDTKRGTSSFDIEGKTVYLQNVTTYTSDNRLLHDKSLSYNTNTYYYYNKENQLYLKRYVNEYQSEDSERFWYDEKGNPVRLLKYRASPEKKPIFDGYEEISYSYYDYEENLRGIYTDLEFFSISSDTLMLDNNRYDDASFDINAQPETMNKFFYRYDEVGRLQSAKSFDGNKYSEYTYEGNMLLKILETHFYGSTIDEEVLYIFNKEGDLQSKGRKGGPNSYEYDYEYDKKGNWVVKKHYYVNDDGSKKMTRVEARKIHYYADGEINMGIDESMLTANHEINYMAYHAVGWAKEKQERLDAYKRDIESGNYGKHIDLESANDINDFTPRHWHIIDRAEGDLNGDSIPDKVVVYKTPVAYNGWDESCCLVVYKRDSDRWVFWYQSFAPVLSPQAGGMTMNTFQGVGISDQCIFIGHEGMSSGAFWSFVHSYKFIDDDWYLVYTERSVRNACHGSSYEYNLLSGDLRGSSYTSDCEDRGVAESEDKHECIYKLEVLPSMNDGEPGGRELKIPNTKIEFIIY